MHPAYRIGFGYDVHQLKEDLPFILGGIEIPFSKGPVAHSDGDVLIHAICDALLGAACMGDIGLHFPDTSDDFKDIDSKELLKRVKDLIEEKGFILVNIDSTVSLERPKLREHIDQMRSVLASVLDTDTANISIKATTTEKMGFIGREEGIAAQAVVLIKNK
jgi:2-C-methyl-D-erythritol 2,4-cyclodiphosphate synthase